jgi:hypothetical protein
MIRVKFTKDNRLFSESTIDYYAHWCFEFEDEVWSFKQFITAERRCCVDTAARKFYLGPRLSKQPVEKALVERLLKELESMPSQLLWSSSPLLASGKQQQLKFAVRRCCGSEVAQRLYTRIRSEPEAPIFSLVWWEWFWHRGELWSVWRMGNSRDVSIDFTARRITLGFHSANSSHRVSEADIHSLAESYNSTRGNIAVVVQALLAFVVLMLVI